MEPYKNLPEKYFYDDSSLMEGFAKLAEAQAKDKLNQNLIKIITFT